MTVHCAIGQKTSWANHIGATTIISSQGGDYYPVLRTPAFAFGVFGGVYEASYATISFLFGPETYMIRLNTEQAKEK
jgi:hypothetical protein